MIIRRLALNDLPEILRIQADAYRTVTHEGRDTISRKIELFPQGCLGCEEGGQLIAYVISHPWNGQQPVPLDYPTLQLPIEPDCYYIHDLAVESAYRGQKIGDRLVQHLLQVGDSNGLKRCALVAVQRSEPFWERFGFVRRAAFEYVAGVPASYMMLEIGSAATTGLTPACVPNYQ